jgi:SAM-dependent methyltransferase
MSLTLPGGSDRLSQERDDAHRRFHEAFAALDRIVNDTGALATRAEGGDGILPRLATFQSLLVQFLQQLTPYVDTKLRVIEQLAADAAIAATAAQRAATAAQRASGPGPQDRTPVSSTTSEDAGLPALDSTPDAVSYVSFEDLFRGSEPEIRARQADYVPIFSGAHEVLDVGCGRGEFLVLLREAGITSRGIDANDEMVAICRERGLPVERADAVEYLRAQGDGSLGGLFAAQLVEHLQPARLMALLREAARVLRPGAPMVLETINPTCWVAFFESYIRDLTHVKPLHPDTLKFLAVATGFAEVKVLFRTPVDEAARLQRLAPTSTDTARVAELVEAFNRNVERLNDRLFTFLDYAVIGVRA